MTVKYPASPKEILRYMGVLNSIEMEKGKVECNECRNMIVSVVIHSFFASIVKKYLSSYVSFENEEVLWMKTIT